MVPGILVSVQFPSPAGCPVARAAERTGTTVDSVSRSVAPGEEGRSVTEFLLDAEEVSEDGIRPVFSHGSKKLVRVTHDGTTGCPCECLGRFDCPVDSYTARDGGLRLGFYAEDYDQVREVVAALRDRWPEVDVKRLFRSPSPAVAGDAVFVDRTRLTARQREVLETAYEMGYFERPKGANAAEVAAEVGISPPTLAEHLAAAQTKLLGDVLEKR